MDQLHYKEMISAFDLLEREGCIQGKKIYLFGHCNATEELADLLLSKEYDPAAILDNNSSKHGNTYRGIMIESPLKIMDDDPEQTIVCIVARAYAAMAKQLKKLGYKGQIRKLVDYNSYAEYSLSDETIARMKARERRGQGVLDELGRKYPGCFQVLCPFSALGDIYLMMSYLPHFLQKRKIERCVIGVIGRACAQVVRLFGEYHVEVLSQKDMDETIQAALYTRDENVYIPHQDRPYVVDLFKALYIKRISLEQMYCCGVFGLPADTKPYEPSRFQKYSGLEQIKQGRAVILSPYAKSVTSLPGSLWEQIVASYSEQGYQCFTNVAGEELPLPGTQPICPAISEIRSVVERAGTFVGIRSGICDVLRTAEARKIALYPDYYYCDTKWKAIEMYHIDGWENRLAGDDFEWNAS